MLFEMVDSAEEVSLCQHENFEGLQSFLKPPDDI